MLSAFYLIHVPPLPPYLSPAILLHLFFDPWDASHWLLSWSKRHHWLPNHVQMGIAVRE